TVTMRERLYRLGDLVPPQGVPGAASVADRTEVDVLSGWRVAFLAEALGKPSADPAAWVADRLSYGGLTVWRGDGVARSMAPPPVATAGMVRVGCVYTPPAQRQRGYAGAVTAAVSRAAREAGASEVVLFTDLANPTSNGVYQRLGYLPVEDRVVLDLRPA